MLAVCNLNLVFQFATGKKWQVLYVGSDGAARLLQKFENFKRLLGTNPSGPWNSAGADPGF